MNWRKDTLAEKADHRHSDSLWIEHDELADLRESIPPAPVPFDWLGFALGVLCLGLLAVSLALAIGELWHG